MSISPFKPKHTHNAYSPKVRSHPVRTKELNTLKFVYPKMRPLYAIPTIAITVLIMAYSGLIGTLPILAFYAIWFPLAIYSGKFIIQPTKDVMPIIFFASYSIASIASSSQHTVTARAAIEFATMIACVIVMSRIVETVPFVKGIIAGCTIVLLLTIINGRYGRDYFSHEYNLIGMFGSKNQVGLFAEIGLYASIVFFFCAKTFLEKIVYSLIPGPFLVACLYLCHSATSVASLAVVLVCVYGMYKVTKFSARRRKMVFRVGIFLTITLGLLIVALGAEVYFFHALGKDTTFTGRTYLWTEGIKNALQNPILGFGYAAFWVPGRPAAEAYWFAFQIYGRSGFHFHELYIQTFVDLGIIGLATMVYLTVSNCTKSIRYILNNGAELEAFFCLGMGVMCMVRAFAEVDFLGPFGVGCMLFYAIPPRLAMLTRTQDQTARSVPAVRSAKITP